jgi:hypothetical protein
VDGSRIPEDLYIITKYIHIGEYAIELQILPIAPGDPPRPVAPVAPSDPVKPV